MHDPYYSVTPGDILSEVLTAESLNAMQRMAVNGLTPGNLQSSPGTLISRPGSGGTMLRRRRPRRPPGRPMDPWTVLPGSDATHFRIWPGRIKGVMADIGFTPLNDDEPPEVEVTGGTGTLYWRIEATPVVSNEGTEDSAFYTIKGITVNRVEIVSEAEEEVKATVSREDGSTVDGEYWYAFASLVDGVVMDNARCHLFAGLCDISVSSEEGEGELSLWIVG